jgi:hypothetical protein
MMSDFQQIIIKIHLIGFLGIIGEKKKDSEGRRFSSVLKIFHQICHHLHIYFHHQCLFYYAEKREREK